MQSWPILTYSKYGESLQMEMLDIETIHKSSWWVEVYVISTLKYPVTMHPTQVFTPIPVSFQQVFQTDYKHLTDFMESTIMFSSHTFDRE